MTCPQKPAPNAGPKIPDETKPIRPEAPGEAERRLGQRDISNEELLGLLTLKPLEASSMPQILKMERLCHVDQWTSENFHSELQRAFTVAKGLWLGHSLVGLSLSWMLPPECHLLNLMVHPNLWGRGLGKFLVNDLIETAKSNKAYKIILEVKVGNKRAERLYKRVGFTGSGFRRAYYSDGSNASIMTLELPAPPGAPLVATKRYPPKPPLRGGPK
ncbi:MAG: ribosomal protein S18-alanine N-acetyltransferase [Deltaproteobacteria bacterium]|jgi:ribosomal-protein-alanine N-acetyltransferase|nr:ribosomal protein S18-alanine N-acetyltransferase [Deltaproteobacteria bacterium]